MGSAAGIAMRGPVAEQGCDDFAIGQVLASRIDHDLSKLASAPQQSLSLGVLFLGLGPLLREQVPRF